MTAHDILTRYEARWLPLAMVEPEDADAAQRLQQANAWVDEAADLIAAYMELYDAHDRAFSIENVDSRAKLLRMYANAMSEVRDELEGYRDDALSRACVTTHHLHDTPEAIAIGDATNDFLSEHATTVADALKVARSAWGMA